MLWGSFLVLGGPIRSFDSSSWAGSRSGDLLRLWSRRTSTLIRKRLLALVSIDSSESLAVQPELAFDPSHQLSHRGSTQDTVRVVVLFRRKEESGLKHET